MDNYIAMVIAPQVNQVRIWVKHEGDQILAYDTFVSDMQKWYKEDSTYKVALNNIGSHLPKTEIGRWAIKTVFLWGE